MIQAFLLDKGFDQCTDIYCCWIKCALHQLNGGASWIFFHFTLLTLWYIALCRVSCIIWFFSCIMWTRGTLITILMLILTLLLTFFSTSSINWLLLLHHLFIFFFSLRDKFGTSCSSESLYFSLCFVFILGLEDSFLINNIKIEVWSFKLFDKI